MYSLTIKIEGLRSTNPCMVNGSLCFHLSLVLIVVSRLSILGNLDSYLLLSSIFWNICCAIFAGSVIFSVVDR